MSVLVKRSVNLIATSKSMIGKPPTGIPVPRFQNITKIGEGSETTFFSAFDRTHKKKVAICEMKTLKDAEQREFFHNILKDSDQVVKLLERHDK